MNVIDLSTIIGEVKIHERLVHGRNVKLEDVLFEEVPAFEALFTSARFAGVYENARKLLERSEVEGGFDEDWFNSIPFSEAFDLIAFALYPDVANEHKKYEPVSVRVRLDLEMVLPPFTLRDAYFFGHQAEGIELRTMLAERLGVILDNATLPDGSPIPPGSLSDLTRQEVGALIEFYINRSVEREEKNAETLEPSSENEVSTGKKPSGPSRRNTRATTSKKAKKDTSASSG